MKLRRFNSKGIESFQAFLDSLSGPTPMDWPETALSDSGFSEALDRADVTLEHRQFLTRFELAQYLHNSFQAGGLRPLRGDHGLWAWIACFYFFEICPTRGTILKPGAAPRWIPRSTDWRRYYRHLIAGPYGIYVAHRDQPNRAMALLCQKPGSPGDLVEQLASRQEVVTNPTIMQVATDLFVDPSTGRQRKAANSKGTGGPRRMIDVLKQLDVTWDLSAMSASDLRERLPTEFQSQ